MHVEPLFEVEKTKPCVNNSTVEEAFWKESSQQHNYISSSSWNMVARYQFADNCGFRRAAHGITFSVQSMKDGEWQ
jgi:hypothetical protein